MSKDDFTPVPGEREDMANALRELAAQAQAGKVSAVAIAARTDDGLMVLDYSTESIATTLPVINLGIDLLKARIMERGIKGARPAEKVNENTPRLVV